MSSLDSLERYWHHFSSAKLRLSEAERGVFGEFDALVI